jgi:hypothetical protein
MLLYGFVIRCEAGNDNHPTGARSAGTATASVTHTDIWASANNQAGLAWLEEAAAALYYENRWNMQPLPVHAGVVALPVKATVIGVSYRYFGFSKYNETKIGLAAAKKLWEKFALGVQVDYFRTYFAYDYGKFNVLSAEAGLLYEPVKHLTVGMHVFNMLQSKHREYTGEYIPTVMRFGVGYTIPERAVISVETEKDLRMKPVFKAGLEFMPVKNVCLRYGMSNGLMYQYAFGIGYSWKRCTFDMAFSRHKLLGYSPHISVIAHL